MTENYNYNNDDNNNNNNNNNNDDDDDDDDDDNNNKLFIVLNPKEFRRHPHWIGTKGQLLLSLM